MNGLSGGGAVAPTLTPDHPYPGLLPFGERDQTFFHGRDAEQVELFRLVRSKVLTVLFGQSGLGKTSLLQAGLFPRLWEAQALPVAMRLNFEATEVDLTDAARRAIAAELATHEVDAPPPEPVLTLWEYFHRTPWWDRRNRLLTPVLVFDQFEELFTLGRNDARAAAFLEQLADLAENRIPAAVRARLEQGATLDFDYDQPSYALVISLREDFLPDLDDLRDRLPSLLQNRLRLLPLNGAQALEAVAQPAPELLGPALAEEIVRFVAGADRGSPTAREERALADLTVEPALLALVCQQLNQQRLQKEQAAITADLLRGSKDRLLPDFYERCVADVDVGVRQFIEERLLTASGFRRAEAVDDTLRWPEVSEAALATLIDLRLLRREERFGTPHIELVHDVLTGTVQASRDLRRRREEARKRRRRWMLAGGMVGGIAVLALATTIIFVNLYWQAETQRQRAEQHRQQAEQLIDFMLFGLRDSLEKVGRLDLLEQPAQRALRYFSSLPEAEMLPEAVRQRGAALDNIGDVLLAKGDLDKALAAYQASLAIRQRLAQQDPANAGWQHDLSVSHDRIGDMGRAQGDLASALAAYQGSLAIRQRLARQDPANTEWQRDLSISHERLGNVRRAQGDLAGALAAYQTSLAIRQRLVQQDPANAGWLRDLSISHEKLGDVRQAQGDLAGALATHQASLAIHQRLAQQDPANADWQRSLSISHDRIGDVRRAQGDPGWGFFRLSVQLDDSSAAGRAGPGQYRVATRPVDQPRQNRRRALGAGQPG